jgi:hypothetical protein
MRIRWQWLPTRREIWRGACRFLSTGLGRARHGPSPACDRSSGR